MDELFNMKPITRRAIGFRKLVEAIFEAGGYPYGHFIPNKIKPEIKAFIEMLSQNNIYLKHEKQKSRKTKTKIPKKDILFKRSSSGKDISISDLIHGLKKLLAEDRSVNRKDKVAKIFYSKTEKAGEGYYIDLIKEEA